MSEHGGLLDGETYRDRVDTTWAQSYCFRRFRPGCLSLLGSEAIAFDAHPPSTFGMRSLVSNR